MSRESVSPALYEYRVKIPGEATLDDVDAVVEFFRGIAAVEPNLAARWLYVQQQIEVDPVDGRDPSFWEGYALREAEDEVETELRSRAWTPPGTPWKRVGR